MIGRLVLGTIVAATLVLSPCARAELLFDRGIQVEGLWLFPSQEDPLNYRYVPEEARVTTNENGEPYFSLTFFVSEEPAEDDDEFAANSIAEADGGAILHVLLEYATNPETVARAQGALRRRLGEDEAFISGPIVFDSATFSVVSSVLTGEGSRSATLLVQRSAPVLEGQAIALSFELEPRTANILLATLQTDTPDFSGVFSLEFHGLTDGYDAEMVIDWQKTKESMQAGGGANIYVVSLEAEATIESAFQEGAIRLIVHGDDAAMEGLVELAYKKAMDMLYAPIEIDQVPASERGGMMEAMGTMLDSLAGETATTALGFGLSASYRMKDLRSEGISRLSFEKSSSVSRTAMLTMNLGSFYAEYGDDERFVRVESIGDCDFMLRRVYVLVDGALRPEIGSFVNQVTVKLRKQHESGEVTVREVMLTSQNAGKEGTHGPMTYAANGDPCDEEWLAYQYSTAWNFVGGGDHTADWRDSSAASISLTAPYHRQQVEVTGDLQTLLDNDVRAVIVEVTSEFFGETRAQRRRIIPGSGADSVEPISIVLPEGVYAYAYRITWLLSEGERREVSGRDDLGYIFVDEIPDAACNLCKNGVH